MLKKRWKECSCGITTDEDEENCPGRGLGNNSEHQLKVVELTEEELRQRGKERRVFSKDLKSWDEFLK